VKGRLFEAVAFDEPATVSVGDGGTVDGYEEKYACRAEFIYSRGSEVVDAARLEGRAIYKVKIRSSAAARAIRTDWQMRDTRRSVTYNIREIDAISDRQWIFIVVESGVAT
tara:strand:- start:26530 stop:26862 length:333 start_codon:yes stop_codon:yes gene_type:complete